MRTEQRIEEFIARIKRQYPALQLGYKYDDECEYYDIWHTDDQLQYENKEFLSFVGQQISEMLYAHDIYNISFGYDPDRVSRGFSVSNTSVNISIKEFQYSVSNASLGNTYGIVASPFDGGFNSFGSIAITMGDSGTLEYTSVETSAQQPERREKHFLTEQTVESIGRAA